MTRLVYQPAFDPYNTAFRLLQIREAVWTKRAVEFDLVRIADFYLLFPFLIEKIRLKPAHRKYKKLATANFVTQPYARLPEESALLISMKPFQLAAAKMLVDSDLADAEAWKKGKFLATKNELPHEVSESIKAKNLGLGTLIEFLGVFATDYDFLGENGLKHRTGLLEYRYDTV